MNIEFNEKETDKLLCSESYDMVDCFLRNNLDDDDYADYSMALDHACGLGEQKRTEAIAQPVQLKQPTTPNDMHTLKMGGCPSCGSQTCIARSCAFKLDYKNKGGAA